MTYYLIPEKAGTVIEEIKKKLLAYQDATAMLHQWRKEYDAAVVALESAREGSDDAAFGAAYRRYLAIEGRRNAVTGRIWGEFLDLQEKFWEALVDEGVLPKTD